MRTTNELKNTNEQQKQNSTLLEAGQSKQMKSDTDVQKKPSICDEKPKKSLCTLEDLLLQTDDGDIEIKIANTDLTDAESKLFEERYFIPIEQAESCKKVG